MDTTHFLASVSSTICGENRIGITATRDRAKVTCKACLETLAVTVLVKSSNAADPLADPASPDNE